MGLLGIFGLAPGHRLSHGFERQVIVLAFFELLERCGIADMDIQLPGWCRLAPGFILVVAGAVITIAYDRIHGDIFTGNRFAVIIAIRLNLNAGEFCFYSHKIVVRLSPSPVLCAVFKRLIPLQPFIQEFLDLWVPRHDVHIELLPLCLHLRKE